MKADDLQLTRLSCDDLGDIARDLRQRSSNDWVATAIAEALESVARRRRETPLQRLRLACNHGLGLLRAAMEPWTAGGLQA